MNGLILVYKEKNMTSHDVVNQIRKIYQTKRVGHLGTLDPMAEGLLVVCLNEATKLVPFLENDDKVYQAEITIGLATTTYDLEGEITDDVMVELLDPQVIDDCLTLFVGVQTQIPPIYSAIKVGGKKLYEYARKNETVDIPKRTITIKSIQRIGPINYDNGKIRFWYEAHVSKGTYMRSLCVDIASSLGYPGLMSDLIRLKSGQFSLSEAKRLSEIRKEEDNLISMLDALKGWTIVQATPAMISRISSGMRLNNFMKNSPQQIAFKNNEQLLGIYELDEIDNQYKAVRIWN